MIEIRYKNAFKEVYEILQNTEEDLVQKVPKKFITFLIDNMNKNYQTNINTNLDIDKQTLLPETEAILSLIFRSYWATNEEKAEFSIRDKQELLQIEKNIKNQYKDVNAIFEKKQNLSNITLDTNLMIIKKENFIQKILKKIFKLFKK